MVAVIAQIVSRKLWHAGSTCPSRSGVAATSPLTTATSSVFHAEWARAAKASIVSPSRAVINLTRFSVMPARS